MTQSHSNSEIEKIKPLPKFSERRGRKAKYPFRALKEVGMAFFVPNVTTREVWSAITYWNRKLNGAKFKPEAAIKNGVEGVRVWRVR